MMIGWFNGTMVDKTRLPSFIVTLGTFFILIGAKAGFSRLLAGQVVVEGLNESDGYDFWSKIFAASWIRNDHLWEDRDVAWTILLIVGAALVAIGVLELSYRRAEQRNAKGLIVAASVWWSPSPGSTACSTATACRRTSSTAPSSALGSLQPCSAGRCGGSRRSVAAAP